MKYPVWIKLEEDGRILKAITYLGISDCYDCRYKGKRELIDGRTPCLYSRDKKTWLTFDELDELDNPKVEYPEGSAMSYIDKYLAKAFEEVFRKECKKEIEKNERRTRGVRKNQRTKTL